MLHILRSLEGTFHEVPSLTDKANSACKSERITQLFHNLIPPLFQETCAQLILNYPNTMTSNFSPGPGGFIPPGGLPSPAPSSSSTRSVSGLPHPRAKSLRPGSSKEDMVRRYVEERLLEISRRYVKKFGNPEPGDTVVGYKTFGEVCRDLDGVVNVLWLSGTREL